MPLRPPQKPRRLLTRDRGEEQSSRMQKGRSQLHTAQMIQMEPPETIATKTEQTTQRAREFKSPVATHPALSGPEARPQSGCKGLSKLFPLGQRDRREPTAPDTPATGRYVLVLAAAPQSRIIFYINTFQCLLYAFQDIFKLFSCSPTGTVDMRSMKTALRNVGIQLGPQEMCEALRLADLDGDGIVSFKDFLGVLTDNHYLVQFMRQVRNRWVSDPRSLKTLFIEMLFKLLSQGFVPSRSAQEVMSYYFKKQRALQLSPGCRGWTRGQGRPSRTHAGLNYFCQAARVSGLSNSELARSLHTLYKGSARPMGRSRGPEPRGWGPRDRGLFRSHTVSAPTSSLRGPTPSTVPSPLSSWTPAPGARSPYSQIPKLAGRTRPECRTRSRIPAPDVRLPKPHQPGRSKFLPNLGPLSPGYVDESLEQMRLSKRALSPATLVQKQPFSPSPASLQKQAVKSLYK